MISDKKNASDYIEQENPNYIRITSLAYWLTAEGLNNHIEAEMLRDSIASLTDEEFHEVFDGATKDDAKEHLFLWELCYMPYWGCKELVKAICSESGIDKELLLRSIKLAQKIKELPKVFAPNQGVLWAIKNGYLVANTISHWVNIDNVIYGHPHNKQSKAIGARKISVDELLTNPPKTFSEPFEFLKQQANIYIQQNDSLPSKSQLWSFLQENFPKGKRKNSINISKLNRDWDCDAFYSCFKRWTTKPNETPTDSRQITDKTDKSHKS